MASGNVFDQFDQAPVSPPRGGNVFDQFDAPAPTAASFSDRYGDGPMASKTDISSGLGEGVRRVADEMLVGKPDADNIAAAGTLRAINTAGLNVPRALGSALQSLPGIGNGQGYSQNYEAAKEREEAYARQAPYAAGLGTATGIVGGAVALPSFQAAKGANLVGRATANALTGAGYGALTELVDNQDLMKAAAGGAIGGVAGGLLTPVAEKAASLVGRGVSAIAGSPYFAKGAQVQNAAGELTSTAKAVLKQAGIAPDDLTPELQTQIVAAFSRKGESPAVAREALNAEFGIPLSRGQATGDAQALALEQAALVGDRGSKAEGAGRSFLDRQQSAIASSSRDISDRLGRGLQVENPTQAAEAVADQARAFYGRSVTEADRLQAQADEALAAVRGPAPLDQVDAARVVAGGLREKAGEAKAAYRGAYQELADLPGEFHPQAFDGMGQRVATRLGDDVPIDPYVTPMASRALADLDGMTARLNLPEGRGPTADQIENQRKRFSLYLANTAQNPTDRRAVGRIRDLFTEETQGLAEIGRFGPRSEPVGGVGGIVDDFPGIPGGGLPGASEAIPAGARAARGRQGEPESLLRFLEREGLPYDAETRALDLHRRPAAGYGTLARRDAPTWDQLRTKLTEAGFDTYDEAGAASAASVKDRVLNAIQDDLVNGRKTYRIGEEGQAAGSSRALDRVVAENADNAAMIDRQARRITIDMEGYGVRPQDLDRAALNDAAEMMVRGEADDAATAYDRAVARRGADAGEAVVAPPAPGDDVPFPELGDGFTPAPAGSALPSASPEGAAYAETAGKARQLFSEYRKTFAPQGAGDDVGRAMRDVIEREREPVETARALYGSNSGLSARVADRVKSIVGEGSEAWAAHQQGFLSSIVNGRDMSPAAVSARIQDALSGQKRDLAYRVLTDDQVKGLRQFQTAAQAAKAARQDVPDWIATLGRSDFDPNRITGDLFGSGVPGSRVGSASYASALKRFVGEDSEAWSGMRQAAWRRLVETPDGSAQLAPRVMAQRIQEFTAGKGSGLAKQMFSAEELAEIRRFGTAVQNTVGLDGKARPNGGGVASKIMGKALDGIAAALGFSAGGVAGASAAYTGRFGSQLLLSGYQGRAARQSFEGGAPRLPRPASPVLDLRQIGVGSGLSAEYGL
ncbi:hypothetical protein [Methylobacterium flocculans]|uniref:hypothetical protein n=1 Tax=Methylobacterium flocculans TaxID=2984843 RepID=UPI0021F2B4B7|nr:hypothetical protein [Methylobacterium sp. FF17]